MKFSMGDIDDHCMIGLFKERFFFYISAIVKYDEPHFPSYDDQGLIFIRIEMSVRLNVRAGFHRIEQAVADIFIRMMKIIILAQPG